MEKLFIAADYWTGEDSLPNGYPWLVPDAVVYLSRIVNKTMNILEFGSGGSTIFFGKRCLQVCSYETDLGWYDRVHKQIVDWKINTIFYNLIGKIDDIQFVGSVDLLYVDSDPKVIDRMELIRRYKGFVSLGGYLLLDNYNAFGCHDSDKLLEGWEIKKWDDLHWWGNGTKIYKRVVRV